MNKILLVDKPEGWTSFDIVAKIRGILNTKHQIPNTKQKLEIQNSKSEIRTSKKIKVGHAGTLDPFATGLLIVLVGDATKNQDQFMKLDKEYLASIYLGSTSSTGDPEGSIEEIPNSKYQIPNKSQISNILKEFTGETEQIPPAFSAIKIDGQRAYKLARAGKEVKLEPRKIMIYKLQITNYKFPNLGIRVSCSSGTYIRTLAEDIGKALGCGAYLTALRRTKIGKYNISNAETIDKITESINEGSL